VCVAGIRGTTTLKRNSPRSFVHRPSSIVAIKSLSFREFCIPVSGFWFLLYPGFHYPLDGGGNSCPRNGPRSCSRNSACNGNRPCRSNSDRSGPLTWYRIGARSSSWSSVPFWCCTCALTCTRSPCRNSPRTHARLGPRNSDRYGRRNGSQNSIRSSLCSGPTISPRTGLCPAVCADARLIAERQGQACAHRCPAFYLLRSTLLPGACLLTTTAAR
jgi:hypothetical protein